MVSSKLNIIRIVFEFYPMKGGSITHIINLSEKINPFIKKQIVVAPDFKNNKFDKNWDIEILRIPFLRLELLKKLKMPTVPIVLISYAINVIKIIKNLLKNNNEKYIIHVHGNLLGSYIITLLKIFKINVPVIIMQHSGNTFKISKKSNLSTKIAFFLFKFNKPDILLILDDGADINGFKKICRNKDINYDVVYHGIDTKKYVPEKCSKPPEFVVLSTNRLDKFKSVHLSILGFKKFIELIDDKNNVKMKIIGSGSEYPHLKKLVEDENISEFVEFHGEKNIHEIPTYLNESDVVVGTSLISNLNLSIQEAMAVEKPVLVFDSGNIKKLINNMENGVLIKSGDIDDFAENLKILYENHELRLKIGKNARKTIINERSWDSRIKKELNIYKKILDKRSLKV
ncbi:glycosyl transferase group 1 [Methanococcus vannielii SB]|uniref:Glycosyl transferase group 1 n=1 Tax=Methanococcus vannielii (strain ATCC 35089 / DSM 1224 / JCM 13029 / OCM 148 / SB) TaxID=406327 RepID=A6UNN9_METVS|nr:glycosyltransferase family 4 protein [Methanococcus vannielii]ABR54111.1 glycosyl transferase group 1 [Methanococcus vannielii SB]